MDTKTKESRWLTPAQMAERSGVSIETLRYYEREGLINTIERTTSGHRRYNPDDVMWIEVLRCLRDTGMSIEQLRQYCDLGEQGDHTQPERLHLLQSHRETVLAQIAQMHESLKLIDHKIDFYLDGLAKIGGLEKNDSLGSEGSGSDDSRKDDLETEASRKQTTEKETRR